MPHSSNACACQTGPTSTRRKTTDDTLLRAVLQTLLGLTRIPFAGYMQARNTLERPLSKLQVTAKSVEAANRMLQERGSTTPKVATWVAVKPATPTPAAIAKAGERALQASKK
jgi:hypothetical protein